MANMNWVFFACDWLRNIHVQNIRYGLFSASSNHMPFEFRAVCRICDMWSCDCARKIYISILNTQRLQNNSLVLSVKFVEANKGYGNWIPRPIVPHCPSNCMVRGCVAPNRGCSAVTLKSGCGEKLIWSLIGRPFRQSEPDHDVGNNILMVSNRVLVAVYSFSEVEVNNSWKKT